MVTIYTDGASAGNPGKAGIGYLIYKKDTVIKKGGVFIGVQTNNFAEYMALIFSLTQVLAAGEKECRVFTDSQLVCEQIKGNYKVKNNNIYSLFILAKEIISNFSKFEIIYISREENKEADALARKASQMKER